MAGIATQNDLISAYNSRYRYGFSKNSVTVAGAGQWVSLWNAGGEPAGVTLTSAIGNTTSGVVPDSTTAGGMKVPTPGSGLGLWLTQFDVTQCSLALSSLCLYDRCFHLGAISITGGAATTTFSGVPAITRAPADWSELEIWFEVAQAVSNTGTTVGFKYTNPGGTTGQVTGTQNVIFWQAGRMSPVSLATGDWSIQKITDLVVAGTTATTGTINVIAMRRLVTRFCPIKGIGSVGRTDPSNLMIPLFDSSYLCMLGFTGDSAGSIGTVSGEYSIMMR